MNKYIKAYEKFLGSGPIVFFICVGLFGVAFWLDDKITYNPINIHYITRYIILGISIILTILAVIWAIYSLPILQRGCHVCTTGAFHWVRHPLYASFLSIFIPGFAIFMNHWIYFLWVFLVHLLCHIIILYEEFLMKKKFGQEYIDYCIRTGRFFPRLNSFLSQK